MAKSSPRITLSLSAAAFVGMETADFMREKGVKTLTLVEMLATHPF